MKKIDVKVESVFRLSSETTMFLFINHPTNKTSIMPPKGRIKEVLTNSIISKIFIPMNLNSDHRLKENTEPNPTSHIVNPKNTDALFRDISDTSLNHAIPGSIKEIEDVHAAMVKSRKKTSPKKRPFAISEKPTFSVTNTKPGPCAGSNP